MATVPKSTSTASAAPKRAVASKSATAPVAKTAKVLDELGPASDKPKKTTKRERIKMKKTSFHMLETESDALVALKLVLSDTLGKKIKKEELLRVAVRLLLKQTQTKVKAELVALADASGNG